MFLFLCSLGLLILGGLIVLWLKPFPRAASIIAASFALFGSSLGILPAIDTLLSGNNPTLRWPWHVPYGEFHVTIDALSAFFLIAIFVLAAVTAIFGVPYMRHYEGRKFIGASWFFFNLLIASMALVVVARNGILFMVAWEVMALASFFLVTFEYERDEVRSAGLTYLIATHLGTAFLLAMFAILGKETGSLDFDQFRMIGTFAPATASLIFITAIIGFGSKAGIVPMHIWLPEAHPAAPSHVSALMSGVMIKTGIYGILRIITFMDTPPIWWGILLIGIGLSSGLLGVLFALAQHNLKRLLAYHSIENIGIIAMGMGVGLLALSEGLYSIAILGFAGAILHVMNHAAFKGLLFLGAGSVFHSTGQHDMDNQGGLIKRMPVTGVTFLIGAAAIAGLPPLNGFVSELLIFLGAFKGSVNTSVTVTMSLVALIGGLGLIGGLAIACFTKAYGVVFLGEPRTDKAANAHDGGPLVQIPLLALAVICVFIGVFPLISIRIVLPVVSQIAGVPIEAAEFTLIGITSPFVSVTISAMIVICISIFITLLRIGILARKEVRTSVTWDCGYEFPSARMQYTSSSFAQPVMHIFHKILRTRVQLHAAEGYFPRQASLHSDTPDVFTNRLYQPMAIWIEGVSSRLRWLQQGRIHIYLLYIFVTLIVLLVWKLGF